QNHRSKIHTHFPGEKTSIFATTNVTEAVFHPGRLRTIFYDAGGLSTKKPSFTYPVQKRQPFYCQFQLLVSF
ncbi:MAG: hypothetical protein Q4D85_03055, partial [Corynebacterium sp.]|nr:hypothetical protein [Corynebacterium sp.]